MCGIFGVISSTKIENHEELYSSSMKLKQRGPERQSVYQTDNIFLMFHRLCIINKSNKGDGPFVYSEKGEKSVFVLCNGEIYNYKTLKFVYRLQDAPNDTSYIYPVFKQLKSNGNSSIEAFKLLNASLTGSEYALAIVECEQNAVTKIFLSVDTSSVRPLFYSFHDGKYAFSSLLKGLTNIVPQNTIKRFRGGQMICIDCVSNQIVESSYIENFLINEIKDEDCLKTLIVKKFTKAVKDRCESDREIGCLLSGGLDSSLVAAIASEYTRKSGKKLKTFTIGMKDATDFKYARLVATHIQSDHTEIYFTKEEGLEALEDVIKVTETYDITTIRASVGQYLIAKWISKNTNIKVLLNGDGSDEIMCGYLYFHNAPNEIELHNDSIRLINDIHLFDGLRVDRCISQFGLEARLPFLDYEIVKFFKNLSPALKKPINGMEKFFIRNAFDNIDILPHEVLFRKKEAFSDGISDVSKSWYLMVQEYIAINKKVDTSIIYEHLQPVSYESAWYRQVFEKEFGDCAKIIPYYWLPKFTSEPSTEPSARTLKIY